MFLSILSTLNFASEQARAQIAAGVFYIQVDSAPQQLLDSIQCFLYSARGPSLIQRSWRVKNHDQAIFLSFLVSSISNLCCHTSNHMDYNHFSPLTNQDKPEKKTRFLFMWMSLENFVLVRHRLGLNSKLPAKENVPAAPHSLLS